MQQFFTPEINASDEYYSFDEQESKHIARVLRKVSGEQIRLTNGKGDLFWGVLDVLTPKKCNVSILKHHFVEPPKTRVHIAVSPTKNMDRFEWFLEKATELGACRITPILCARSERKQLKLERCNKIISSAVKQSLRAYSPKLDPLTTLKNLKTDASTLYIAHCENLEKTALKDVVVNKSNCCILIGPEGDFTINEIHWAINNNIMPVHLGTSRLRTETAALTALHTAILLNA